MLLHPKEIHITAEMAVVINVLVKRHAKRPEFCQFAVYNYTVAAGEHYGMSVEEVEHYGHMALKFLKENRGAYVTPKMLAAAKEFVRLSHLDFISERDPYGYYEAIGQCEK